MSSNVAAPAKGTSGLGLASFILGVVAFVVALIPCLGFVSLPVSAIGIIFGLVATVISAKGKQSGLGFPIAGLVISCIAFAVPFVWVKAAQTVVENELEKEDKEIREGDAIKVSVTDLFKEYKDQKIAADKKYKDKVIEVEGEIVSFEEDEIKLKGEGEDAGTVECTFTDAHKDELAKLKKGQKVTVRGMGNGDFFGTPRLRRCILK